jgi:hypothetical protein
VALTAYENIIVDNTSWIAIPIYVMQNWKQVLLVIHLQKLENSCTTTNSLTATLSMHGGLGSEATSSKLMYFGVNGVIAFQGQKNGVTK